MKFLKLIITLIVLGVFVNAHAQTASAIDKYFKQYVDDERFTVVYISPKLFKMLGQLDVKGMNIEDEEAKAFVEIAQDLEALRILVAEEDAAALYKEAKAKIDTKEYEVLMTVRDKDGDNVEFLVKDDGGSIVNELLLLVGGDEFVMLSFVGKIDLNKVSKLGKSMENKHGKSSN